MRTDERQPKNPQTCSKAERLGRQTSRPRVRGQRRERAGGAWWFPSPVGDGLQSATEARATLTDKVDYRTTPAAQLEETL